MKVNTIILNNKRTVCLFNLIDIHFLYWFANLSRLVVSLFFVLMDNNQRSDPFTNGLLAKEMRLFYDVYFYKNKHVKDHALYLSLAFGMLNSLNLYLTYDFWPD